MALQQHDLKGLSAVLKSHQKQPQSTKISKNFWGDAPRPPYLRVLKHTNNLPSPPIPTSLPTPLCVELHSCMCIDQEAEESFEVTVIVLKFVVINPPGEDSITVNVIEEQLDDIGIIPPAGHHFTLKDKTFYIKKNLKF